MTPEAERLIQALLSPTASTSEAVGEMGVDAKLLHVPKLSRPGPTIRVSISPKA